MTELNDSPYVRCLIQFIQFNLMAAETKDSIRKFGIELFEELYEDSIHNKSCKPSSDTLG